MKSLMSQGCNVPSVAPFVRQIMVSLSLKGTLITTSFLEIISSNDFYSILVMKSVVSASLNDSKLFPVCGPVP